MSQNNIKKSILRFPEMILKWRRAATGGHGHGRRRAATATGGHGQQAPLGVISSRFCGVRRDNNARAATSRDVTRYACAGLVIQILNDKINETTHFP